MGVPFSTNDKNGLGVDLCCRANIAILLVGEARWEFRCKKRLTLNYEENKETKKYAVHGMRMSMRSAHRAYAWR